ncbi:MAG: glucose 1-dehydrogenase [Clostridiales bacterium]|nr:glucose 1-dehydrogenase [Clostridiales bacterium]
MGLEGRVAIVTGAGQGMGRGIAVKLAGQGAAVVAGDINEEGARETARIIESGGGRALAVRSDISRIDDIKLLFEECKGRFGAPDIFVANAGLSYSSPIVETDEDEYYKVYDINAKGTFFCLKEAGLQLNDGGRVVAISSSTTKHPKEGMALYTSTKAAIKLMVEVAAQEFAGRGITVNSVMPGLTETPSMMAGLPDEFRQMVAGSTPFKRLGRPEDIAEVVAFLCSSGAGWVNGQHILVDGGCLC